MKKGFTLSEVLITLGIVGVIAALTIPTILKEYRNKIYVSQLKRAYSQISEAAQSIINDENAEGYYVTSAGVTQDNAGTTCKTGPCYLLRNYFKSANVNCYAAGATSCKAASYKSLNGAVAITQIHADFCIQTVNGATICMVHNPASRVSSGFIDVNGPSEPNLMGRDVFSFNIENDGTVTDFIQDDTKCGTSDQNHLHYSAGGCLDKVIKAGWKFDY